MNSSEDSPTQSSSPDISIHGGDVTSDDDMFSDIGISEDETVHIKDRIQKLRKKSVMVSRTKNTEEELLELEESPQNSITSINSISSLLREKLVLTLPYILKKNKPQEYEVKAFVAFLFVIIVALVVYANIHYHQNLLQMPLFYWMRFNSLERRIHVYNEDNVEVLRGLIGASLKENRMYKCLDHHHRPESICMEWINLARVHLSNQKSQYTNCYTIIWESLHEDVELRDCYEISKEFGHWFGGGQIKNMLWPMEQSSVKMSPFITSDLQNHEWGNTLKRIFYNSKGVVVYIDENTPLHISLNHEQDQLFCLQAKYDDFAYYRPKSLPVLNYTICTSSSMKRLHSCLAEKNLWDGLKAGEKDTIDTLLAEPLWEIPASSEESLSESAVYNYTDDIISLGFIRQGHVLLNEFWQPHMGDFILDYERFSTMTETINVIYRRGFRIVFKIQPFISTQSVNFEEAVSNRLLIGERDTEFYIPALTRYKNVKSAGVLDVTNLHTVQWLQSKLKDLKDTYHIDSFYIDYGTAYDIPRHYRFDRSIKNPNDYMAMFTQSVFNVGNVLGVTGAIARPRAPTFVSLPAVSSSWESLQTLIHTVLTYSVIGYPFMIPGAVGGDYPLQEAKTLGEVKVSEKTSSSEDTDDHIPLPDNELYIRWLQLATFLPVIRYTHLPSKYGDDSILEIFKVLTTLRIEVISPLLKKCSEEALDFGTPLIRPLWMLDPNDAFCLTVSDEFSIGNELIVAPILTPSTFEREIYLPSGLWKDGIDGSLRKGSRWLHNYRIAKEKVAYFMKVPNTTRH